MAFVGLYYAMYSFRNYTWIEKSWAPIYRVVQMALEVDAPRFRFLLKCNDI